MCVFFKRSALYLANDFSCPFFLTQMMSSEIFVPGWLQQLLVVLLKFTLSCAAPVNLNNGTECSARGPASYILVFTGHWSPQTFPKQYPLFRPPAQWSKLMGKTLARCQKVRVWALWEMRCLVDNLVFWGWPAVLAPRSVRDEAVQTSPPHHMSGH